MTGAPSNSIGGFEPRSLGARGRRSCVPARCFATIVVREGTQVSPLERPGNDPTKVAPQHKKKIESKNRFGTLQPTAPGITPTPKNSQQNTKAESHRGSNSLHRISNGVQKQIRRFESQPQAFLVANHVLHSHAVTCTLQEADKGVVTLKEF